MSETTQTTPTADSTPAAVTVVRTPGMPERDEQIGIVRVRITEWETPHAARAANAGRLFRGMFVDRKLETNMEIELEADLLGLCR